MYANSNTYFLIMTVEVRNNTEVDIKIRIVKVTSTGNIFIEINHDDFAENDGYVRIDGNDFSTVDIVKSKF